MSILPHNSWRNKKGLRIIKTCYTLAIILLSCSCILAQDEGDSITGKWYTEGCQAQFDFYRSGKEYKAKLYPLDKPDMLDSNNPTDSLKTRKLMGAITIYGLKYNAKKRRWENGKVYNPEDGRTYSCYCSLKKGGKRLFFRGFIGISLLGGSQIWTRECSENQ